MGSKPADPCTGVKPFTIGGRMTEQRLRCLGMTDEERRWRAQFLKDQVLSPDEPKSITALYKDTTNIFRRVYKTPLNWLENALRPKVGHDAAFLIRQSVGKIGLALGVLYTLTYYVKYHSNDFASTRCLTVFTPRGRMFPDEPGYPNYPKKEPYEYYDQQFYSSVLAKKV